MNSLPRVLVLTATIAASALVPVIASASVVPHVAVSSIGVQSSPAGSHVGTIGFTLGNVAANGSGLTSGRKIGHCVDLSRGARIGSDDTLRAGTEVDLRTGDPAGILSSGTSDTRVGAVKWLLLSSLAHGRGGDAAAAHQLAIWSLVNPSTRPPAVTFADPASSSLASELARAAAEHGASALRDPALASGDVGTSSCAGTSRTVTLTGAAFTHARVTVSSGNATIGGSSTFETDLGASGAATFELLGTTPGDVTLSAQVVNATMVVVDTTASDGTRGQNFAYLELAEGLRTLTVRFSDCSAPPVAALPASPAPPAAAPSTPAAPTAAPAAPARHAIRGHARRARVARIGVTKVADTATVEAGNEVRYTITVRSTGTGVARGVRVCDRLPASMSYIRANGARFLQGMACWELKPIAPGATVTLKLTAKADLTASGPATNRIVVTADNADTREAKATVEITAGQTGRAGGVTA